ncbi:DUF4422 domain-containing protein [Clostridium perfringens]|uniref:DUF4422 domain-containing protein n=1 Tax=Clostridium perfringens TaxID=1502 RepID=UPI0028E0F818|nr:DUF4422 domain-containing protein [Clostridium perfringens]MDT9331594.1 DUF4422 domain-containing protein [Clostridium perfringens]
MKDCTFFIVTHKVFDVPKIPNYYPIIVGGKDINLVNSYHDNIGDNIAEKNSNFCELTALYWIWKNFKEDNYIGVCHYRRYFINNRFVKSKDGFLNSEKARKILKKNDIILAAPWGWLDITVKDWYLNTDGKQKDLIELRKIIEELYPEYLEDYDEVMNGYMASYLNMMVTSKEIFDKYSEWLFDILFELEKRIDISSYTPLEARVFGFLSERLLNVWVKHNKLKIKYLQVYQTENSFSQKKILKEDIRRCILNIRKLSKFLRKRSID